MRKNFVYRANCELCGSNKKRVLFSEEFTNPLIWNFLEAYYQGRIDKSDLSGAQYEVVKCLECGFIWQIQILNDELTEKLYNTWISPGESCLKKKTADISVFSGYARQIEVLSFLLGKKPFEIDVLDFGMGWGYWCLMAKAFGYKASGFEISKERIEFAKKNGINVIENFSDITANQFDFINTEQVFEHVPNPIQTLKALARALKKEGLIKISVPNGRGIEQELTRPGWRPSKDAIHPLEHINCFTHQTLVKAGKLAGLELIRQPFLLGYRYNLKSYLKGILGKYYQQYFGTSLYFKKT